MTNARRSITLGFLLVAASIARAADKPTFWLSTEAEDYKIDRAEVFEFTRKPTLSRQDDRVTIRFASKAFCDATVVIEQKDGTILRHLASGCLGPNAPAPFQKNSLEQTVAWDGKNNLGKYVDDLSDVRVRVSLGLKPQFERTLYWHPKKRIGNRRNPRCVARPEGVYVYEGEGIESVRLFGHDGKYIRTVYPFPADKLKDVNGLDWLTFADGYTVPKHRGFWECTYLSGGTGYDIVSTSLASSAFAFAVRGQRIALVPWAYCRGGHGASGPSDKPTCPTAGVSSSSNGARGDSSRKGMPRFRWTRATAPMARHSSTDTGFRTPSGFIRASVTAATGHRVSAGTRGSRSTCSAARSHRRRCAIRSPCSTPTATSSCTSDGPATSTTVSRSSRISGSARQSPARSTAMRSR
jgi:hypothetical protein